ncbi:MerR family transcriptional regulator [Acinetobacter brisouii]|jgi:hypothetical protein|uniref:DNA-binding protein n=1 Tax=Acinetobacter brisouii TaxID=396323 RepID=UPI0005F879CB|nr:DNA-binding protein [Acinetobacter brisouii]KJV37915.1 hypothetical protein VH98_11110 [Acinetobacter brisouii]
MKTENFVLIGQALFGESWQSQVADFLNIDTQEIQDWIRSGHIPHWVNGDLIKLTDMRLEQMQHVAHLLTHKSIA